MATRTMTILTDDISGREGDVETIPFSLDGRAYEIDLGPANAKALRKAIAPYVEKGRKAKTPPAPVKRAGRGSRSNLAEIRAWAQEQGIPVSDRGRIPTSVIEQYDAR